MAWCIYLPEYTGDNPAGSQRLFRFGTLTESRADFLANARANEVYGKEDSHHLRIIGVVIIIIGLLLVPFLPHLIKGSHPADINLTGLYLIYLANTAISYFLFAYMSSLIVVHQRDDVNSSINSIIKIGLMISQIAILLVTKNYYLFSIMMPFFTILNNLLIAWRTKQLFPQYKAEGELSIED